MQELIVGVIIPIISNTLSVPDYFEIAEEYFEIQV